APQGKRTLTWDALVPGLALRTTDTGAKAFVLVRRFPGSTNPTPRALGSYGALTLEQARDKARSWLGLLAKGVDPKVAEEEEQTRWEAERERKRRQKADTFAAAFETFVKLHLQSPKNPLRTAKTVEREMRRLVPADWWARPLRSITRRDVIGVVYGIADGGRP